MVLENWYVTTLRNYVTEGGVTILFCWGGVRLLGSGKFGGGGRDPPAHHALMLVFEISFKLLAKIFVKKVFRPHCKKKSR